MSERGFGWPAPRTVFGVAAVIGLVLAIFVGPPATFFLASWFAITAPGVELADLELIGESIPLGEPLPAEFLVMVPYEDRFLAALPAAAAWSLAGLLFVVLGGLVVWGILEEVISGAREQGSPREGVLGWMVVGAQFAGFGLVPVWALATAARSELGHRYMTFDGQAGELGLACEITGRCFASFTAKTWVIVGEAVVTFPAVLVLLGVVLLAMALSGAVSRAWRRWRDRRAVARWEQLSPAAGGDAASWTVKSSPEGESSGSDTRSSNLCAASSDGLHLAIASGGAVTVCTPDGPFALWSETFRSRIVGLLVQDETLVVLTVDGHLERRSLREGTRQGTKALGMRASHLAGDSRRIAVVGEDRVILVEGDGVLWNVNLPGAQAVALSGDSVAVAAGSTLSLLNARDGQLSTFIKGDTPIRSVAMTGQLRSQIAIGGGEGVGLFDVEPLALLRVAGEKGSATSHVALSDCGSWLAVANSPNTVSMLATSDFKVAVRLIYGDRVVTGLAVNKHFLMVALDHGDGNWFGLRPGGRLSRTDPPRGGKIRRWLVTVDMYDKILFRHPFMPPSE